MSEILVRANSVARGFPGAGTVLRKIDFELRPGEITAIMGANGAGKTTFLKVLSTLVAPDAGELAINGVCARARPTLASRAIGYVPARDQSFHLQLNGRDNLYMFASLRGIARARVGATLDICRALPVFPRALLTPYHECSSGMRQSLAIARALMHEPRVLLLDEPSRSFDPEATEAMHGLVRAFAARGGAAVFVTHLRSEAEALAGRIWELRDGVLV